MAADGQSPQWRSALGALARPSSSIGLAACFVHPLLVLLLLDLSLPLRAQAATVRVVAREVPCPARLRISERLERLLAEDVATPGLLQVELQQARPGVLLVRLRLDGAALDRAMVFNPSDCGELPRAVAEIARGWLSGPLDQLAPGTEDSPPPPPPAAAARSNEPGEQTPLVALARYAAPEPAGPGPWRLSLLARGFLGPSAPRLRPGLAGAIGWEASSRFGVELSGGFDAPVEKPMGTGTLSVSVGYLGALARIGLFASPGAGRLDGLAGPTLQLLDARSRHLAVDGTDRFVRGAATFVLRWQLPLSSRTALLAAVGASVRGQSERLHVGSLEEVFALPPLRAEGSIGLSLAL